MATIRVYQLAADEATLATIRVYQLAAVAPPPRRWTAIEVSTGDPLHPWVWENDAWTPLT